MNQDTKSGIYCIKCGENNRVYVGSSIDIPERWSHHKGLLTRKKHDNIYLQRAWNLYGEQSFSFEILEYVPDKNKLIQREQYWIDYLGAISKKQGFNIVANAGSQLGYKHSKKDISKNVKSK